MTKPKKPFNLWGVENEFGNIVNVYEYQSDAKMHAANIEGKIVRGCFRPIYKAKKLQLPNLKPYPAWVCNSCGYTAKMKKMGHMESMVATYHTAPCDVCGEICAVTEPRDFGYPLFVGHVAP